MNVFESGSVVATIDTTIITTGTVSGTCMVTPAIMAQREYCLLTFDFGDYGTIGVQGPLDKMTIVGTTGCFWWYTGEVLGFNDMGAAFEFAVNAFAR